MYGFQIDTADGFKSPIRKSPIRELPSLENCRPDADVTGRRTRPGRDKRLAAAADHAPELESSNHEDPQYQNSRARHGHRHRARDACVEPFPIAGADTPPAPRTSRIGAAPVFWLRV